MGGEALAIACAEAAIHTGDSDTGDREQTALMKWDAIVIVLHAIFGIPDLYLRIGGSVYQAVFSPNSLTMLFESFLCTSISIFSAPFVLWKLPVAGELFHQLRPTGFDQAGKLRLQMSLAEMKTLHVARMKTASKISKGLDKIRSAGERKAANSYKNTVFSAPKSMV